MAPATAESTARTPLLSFAGREGPTTKSKENIATPSNSEQELQFYDPAVILSVPREVAFGYLILLSGGAAEHQMPPNGKPLAPALDEESASLAYAAIVDGNVLHACFGLKASANGRAGNDTIPAKRSSSVFCCFPKSPAALDALQVALPHSAMNKLRMQKLIEVLREVRDSHLDALESDGALRDDPSEVPTYLRVIQSYVHCFAAVVRYHDERKHLKIAPWDQTSNRLVDCCSRAFRRLLCKKRSNPQLERLRKKTMQDIERGFSGVRDSIGASLEEMATETTFTGISLGE